MINILNSFLSAIAFYTTIPIPHSVQLNFNRLPLWLTWVGLLIASLVTIINNLLVMASVPSLTKAGLVVAWWLYITGGLHLDGVMDSADGLAVQNAQKRLQVMRDSFTGAFGVMAGITVVGLKVVAFSEISIYPWLALILAMTWGRWGQLCAIAFYPYLRREGKGLFLKKSIKLPGDLFLGSTFIFVIIFIQWFFLNQLWWTILLTNLCPALISLIVGWWFFHKLKGHTGDTYGATVEWSEALILCFLTTIYNL